MNDKVKYSLRWIAVIPVALIASFLVLFPIHWLIYFSDFQGTIIGEGLRFLGLTHVNENTERVLDALLVGGTFVYSGAATAPSNHFKTAITLSIVLILFFVYLFYIISSNHGYRLDETFWGFGLKITLAIFGTCVGVYYSRELD